VLRGERKERRDQLVPSAAACRNGRKGESLRWRPANLDRHPEEGEGTFRLPILRGEEEESIAGSGEKKKAKGEEEGRRSSD